MTRYVVTVRITVGEQQIRHWLTFDPYIGPHFTPDGNEAAEVQSRAKAVGWKTWVTLNRPHLKPRLSRRMASGEKENDE